MCRGCLAGVYPRACPFCRAPFLWNDVHNLHCAFRIDPAATVEHDDNGGGTLEAQIAHMLDAPTGEDHLGRCRRLHAAAVDFLRDRGADEVRALSSCGWR